MAGPKSHGAKVAQRHLAILRSIPVLPDTTDTNQVRELLVEEGFDVNTRMVQRDLETLASWHDGELEARDASPKRYGWRPHAMLAPLARLTPHQVLLMRLIAAHLRNALPPSMLTVLEPAFAKAHRAGQADATFSRWSKKVRFEPLGYHPAPPKVRAEVQEAVYRALFDERACVVVYRSQGASSDEELEVEPVGLLVRDGVLTLVVTIDDEPRTRELRLDRMKRVNVLDRARHSSATRVRFDTYVPGGKAVPSLGAMMRVVMLIDKDARLDANARPFSGDQEITEHDRDRRRYAVTIPNAKEVVAWLRGYGPKIEIVAPRELRALFAEEARRAAGTYGAGDES